MLNARGKDLGYARGKDLGYARRKDLGCVMGKFYGNDKDWEDILLLLFAFR